MFTCLLDGNWYFVATVTSMKYYVSTDHQISVKQLCKLKITNMLMNEILMMSDNFQAEGICLISDVINVNM
jgi:hypothetical protein